MGRKIATATLLGTLLLPLGLYAQTADAGGAYAFPAVAPGAWTLALGPLPSNWRMAAGQEARRLVLVVTDEITREDFVLERVP